MKNKPFLNGYGFIYASGVKGEIRAWHSDLKEPRVLVRDAYECRQGGFGNPLIAIPKNDLETILEDRS